LRRIISMYGADPVLRSEAASSIRGGRFRQLDEKSTFDLSCRIPAQNGGFFQFPSYQTVGRLLTEWILWQTSIGSGYIAKAHTVLHIPISPFINDGGPRSSETFNTRNTRRRSSRWRRS
jgi:hypothetical protein